MKRTELIKKITSLGAILERHGAKHNWYVNKETNIGQAVPRHTEIKDSTARRIFLSHLQSRFVYTGAYKSRYLLITVTNYQTGCILFYS